MRRALVVFSLGLAPVSCTKPHASGAPAPAVAATTPAASGVAETPPLPTGAGREHVRAMRWREAATELDALGDAEKKRPDLRYLRARVARELERRLDPGAKPSSAELLARRQARRCGEGRARARRRRGGSPRRSSTQIQRPFLRE